MLINTFKNSEIPTGTLFAIAVLETSALWAASPPRSLE
jgi:hypothetical protein